jgi:4-oxalomesaconate tautomerase
LIRAHGETTRIRIRTLNTGTIADALIETPGGRVRYGGGARIDGVPGTAAPIAIDFLNAEGSVCGALLPTGRVRDRIAGVDCTLIDNGMPVIVLKAADVGRTGHEPRDQLNADAALKAQLEVIRLAAGPLMNLGDVSAKVVPKLCIVAEPRAGGHIATRSFIPHECHASIGVFAAVTVATACVLPGSPASEVAHMPEGAIKTLSVEHPTGEFSVRLEIGGTATHPVVMRAGLLRTARLLFDGTAYLHEAFAS